MRILEQGSAGREDIFRATCTNCGTSVEFERGEARSARDGRDGYIVVVDCPVCLAEIWADAQPKMSRGTGRRNKPAKSTT